MGRTTRLFVENALNHIIARGNHKSAIFYKDVDFELYIRLIRKYKAKYKCCIYGYCLMNNHIHMLLESPLGANAMSNFMKCVNQSYAMIFNHKYNKVGHLWENRYKNFIVLKDTYALNLISYIEFNPVRAGVVPNPEDYPWSSYRSRSLGKQDLILDNMIL